MLHLKQDRKKRKFLSTMIDTFPNLIVFFFHRIKAKNGKKLNYSFNNRSKKTIGSKGNCDTYTKTEK